ncbi:MAG: SDR family oxidoreductase [Paraburkholderia sp.]|nr:SDR family oxidoreductase [Paraburkholderia sp.]
MNRLAGKVALVTGAGRGIGAAIARAFAAEGAAVVLAELDGATAVVTAREIAGAFEGARTFAVQTDVTQPASEPTSVRAAVEAAQREFGPVDVLVNNAGINVFADPLTMTDEDWRRCFAVDLDGVWNGCRAVLPGMVERRGGSIINIASTHAFQIIPGCFPYPVAKHGVIGLTRALGIEYAPKNVRVNAIAPGYIATDMTAVLPDEVKQRILASVPMGRMGRPEDVANAVKFLASEDASYITGQVLAVNGGMYL